MIRREQFRFFNQFRVRDAEIDRQGIVFNAHYLTYFDTSLTEFMRMLGYDYQHLFSRRGLDFHLVKSTIEYRRPIGTDALIDVGVAMHRIGKSSLTWSLAIFATGEVECLTSGEIVWVCSEVGAHKAHPLPNDLVQLLVAYDNP